MNDAHHFGCSASYDGGTTHDDLAPVWDAVCEKHPLVIEHITGPTRHKAIALDTCIRVFHAEAIRLHHGEAFRPDLLVAMFSRWPEGAFASRVGAETFTKDVGELAQRCIDELREKRLKEVEEAKIFPPPEPWVWRDPATIQPRQWLLGTTLLRGYATVIGAAGGIGKTSRGIASTLAIITKRHDITGEHVFQTGKAWLVTLEDDREELERRLAAAMIAHNIRHEDVEGRLFVNDRSRIPLVLIETDEKGNPVVAVDVERITKHIRQHHILLTMIDPLVKAHRGIENRNEHMDAVAGVVNGIASDTFSAVLLAAHFRKGGSDDGSRDAFRGGSALLDGLRLSRTLIPMSEADAKAFNIPLEDASRLIREQNPKANMAPRQSATWFELVSVPLGNAGVDPRYPAGDHVQAIKPWKPPATFEGCDHGVLVRIFGRLRGEPMPGWSYSLRSRAKFWAGDAIIEEAGKSREQAADMLSAWKKNGVITEEDYTDPNRRPASRVMLNEARIAEILAPIAPFHE